MQVGDMIALQISHDQQFPVSMLDDLGLTVANQLVDAKMVKVVADWSEIRIQIYGRTGRRMNPYQSASLDDRQLRQAVLSEVQLRKVVGLGHMLE
jgi:hypothetical protein